MYLLENIRKKTMYSQELFIIVAVISVVFVDCTNDLDAEWKNVVTATEFPQTIADNPHVAVYFAQSKIERNGVIKNRFNNHFADVNEYFEDFGIKLVVVDCYTPTEELKECLKEQASELIYFYRNGRVLTNLPLDTMFSFDSITASILHLVLLKEVPLLQNHEELDKEMDRAAGKRDIIFANINAVGIQEDRVFIETAFAFNNKFRFAMTTSNENFGIDEDWQKDDNSIWLLKCTKIEPGTPCPVVPYTNVMSLEKVVIFMKALQLPNTFEVDDTFEIEFLNLNIPVVYLVGDSTDMSNLREIMHTVSPEFVGNVGFILINRDTISKILIEERKLNWLLNYDVACLYLTKELGQNVLLSEFNIENVRIFLKNGLREEKTAQTENVEEGNEEETIYSTSQETQDDPIHEALFNLKLVRKIEAPFTQQLTDKSFPEFIANESVTMVMFTIKWNPRCIIFVETYAKIGLAASDSISDGINPLARVECSDWPDVCNLNNVSSYPTIKLFEGSHFIKDYEGRLDEADILKEYVLYDTPSLVELHSKEDFQSFYDGTFIPRLSRGILESAVIGIFTDDNIDERKIFEQVAASLERTHLIGECDQMCAIEGSKKFGTSGPSVVIIKWSDAHQPHVVFRDPFVLHEIINFISESSKNILPQLNPATLPSLLHNRQSIVMLFHQQDTSSQYAELELAKVAMSGKFTSTPITWIDASQENNMGRRILESYSLSSAGPQVVLLNREVNSICRYPYSPQFSEPLLAQWLESTLKEPCAIALKHREWKGLVPAYDFLAYIKEEEEEERYKKSSGRIRLSKNPTTKNEENEDGLELGNSSPEYQEERGMEKVDMPTSNEEHEADNTSSGIHTEL